MLNCRFFSCILTALTRLEDDPSKSTRGMNLPGEEMRGGLVCVDAEERVVVEVSDLSDQCLCPPS